MKYSEDIASPQHRQPSIPGYICNIRALLALALAAAELRRRGILLEYVYFMIVVFLLAVLLL